MSLSYFSLTDLSFEPFNGPFPVPFLGTPSAQSKSQLWIFNATGKEHYVVAVTHQEGERRFLSLLFKRNPTMGLHKRGRVLEQEGELWKPADEGRYGSRWHIKWKTRGENMGGLLDRFSSGDSKPSLRQREGNIEPRAKSHWNGRRKAKEDSSQPVEEL
ncbi:unnamed protein product [Linum trigynum]|uniref:Uncharacterized protein n=1 Tax=Linum trigynum TaxID=586398 RepID=A0AAV2DA39_9ROSI